MEEQQVKAMKKRLEEAENFYGSIRKVRHEMKNHMENIKGLAGAGQYGEIEDYVRRMDETMQELEYKYVTGNAVMDVIINDKCRRVVFRKGKHKNERGCIPCDSHVAAGGGER